MKISEYQEQALRTINKSLSPKENLVNATIGLAGEIGEFAELVKKYLFHSHELPLDKALKELGDVQWYISQASHALGELFQEREKTSLEAICKANIEKLKARYAEGFSSEKSINRVE